MAALLIASPRAVALGLQMHRPPCKLIHLSSFFRSSFLSHHILFPACRPAALLPGWTTEGQGRWTFLSTVPTSNLFWTLRVSMVPRKGQDPNVTEVSLSLGGQLEEEASAARWLWVWKSRKQGVKDGPGEHEPSHESLNKYKEERKLPWWSCTLSPADVLFFDGPYFENQKWARDSTFRCQCGA